MRRERLLAAAVAVLLVASVVSLFVVPGVVADRDSGDLRPGRVGIEEVTIAATDVSGGTATLGVTAYLDHRGGDSENVTVQVRVVDIDSGLVETTRERALPRLSGDREVPATVNVSVAREGGYRIETVLYKDDRRVGSVAKAVRGVNTLQAGGRVGFHRFDADLPSVQYSVDETTANRTHLDLSTYLTNSGAEPSGPVTVELVVRQAESNIVTARTTVSADAIAPGETATPGTTVTVPSGYNYYLDAILRKDGVIVGTARSVANLDPRERIAANTTVREVGLRVEEFERTDGPERPPETRAETGAPDGVPGFGPAVALVAILGAAVIVWRRQS